MDKLKSYSLILVYKSTITKEEAENKINKEIYPVFNKFGINQINYEYSGCKLFSYIIDKLKSGHYFILKFKDNGKNITAIQKVLKENNDVLRAISFVNVTDQSIAIINKLEGNTDSKNSYA